MPGGTVSGFRVLWDIIGHAYMVSGPFLTVFGTLGSRFTGRLWHCWTILGTKMGPKQGHFGPFFGPTGSFWGHLVIILALFWHRFGVVLVSF